ncbi:MAG: hypothetical protein AB7P76_10105 [Candidatus Melainabacteria bacterium]
MQIVSGTPVAFGMSKKKPASDGTNTGVSASPQGDKGDTRTPEEWAALFAVDDFESTGPLNRLGFSNR